MARLVKKRAGFLVPQCRVEQGRYSWEADQFSTVCRFEQGLLRTRSLLIRAS